jgi:hypothetical protein
MFNPWIILAVFLAFAGVYLGAHKQGYNAGENAQSALDQKQFDKINAAIAKNKANANAEIHAKQTEIIALQANRAASLKQIEAQNVQNTETTNRLHASYSALGLQYRAAEAARNRPGSSDTLSAADNSTGTTGSPILQLPDVAAKFLHDLAADADALNDSYKECYAFTLNLH